MMLGIAAIVGLITVSVVAATPIQAYINQTSNGDTLGTQDQDRLRTRDCDCTGSGTQDPMQTRLHLHERMSNGAIEPEQCRCQNGGN